MRKSLAMVGAYPRTGSFKGDPGVTESILSRGREGGKAGLRGGAKFYQSLDSMLCEGSSPIIYAQRLSIHVIGEE